jgi:hypothetical protein
MKRIILNKNVQYETHDTLQECPYEVTILYKNVQIETHNNVRKYNTEQGVVTRGSVNILVLHFGVSQYDPELEVLLGI